MPSITYELQKTCPHTGARAGYYIRRMAHMKHLCLCPLGHRQQ